MSTTEILSKGRSFSSFKKPSMQQQHLSEQEAYDYIRSLSRVKNISMIRHASRGLTSEIVAGVCKLMSNLDLIYAAKKIRVSAHCNTTIGLPGTFSSRLQPNHTTDDTKGIIASVMEGLSLGCGDAVIGLNPVDDSVESVARILKMFDEFKRKWEVPTQICVLAHGARGLYVRNARHRRRPRQWPGLPGKDL